MSKRAERRGGGAGECATAHRRPPQGIGGGTVGKVSISPVLLQKARRGRCFRGYGASRGTIHRPPHRPRRRRPAQGDTRLALYGLGYLRDSRLHRMMVTPGEVTWRRPAGAPGAPVESWFNLFFIHQNHSPRGAKNSVSEALLPQWLDFVVWGHEHACRVEPRCSAEAGGTFVVSQPGSSVATTLSEDEALPKKVFLLELQGQARAGGWLGVRKVWKVWKIWRVWKDHKNST